MRNTKFWIVLIAALLGISLLASVWVLRNIHGTTATVTQYGVLLQTIDLSKVDKPYTFTVTGPIGTNTVEVERDRIRVSCADCPDQVCVHQGWLSDGAFPIVCLPNKLVIEIVDAPAGGPDGVAG